jgi:hypothetical protein
MTTPTDPMAGQYVPEDFQAALDLPSTSATDAAGASKAQASVAENKARAAKAMAAYTAASKEAAHQMDLYNAKGATQKQKDAATAARAKALAVMKMNTTIRTAALGAQATAQNAYYSATGQYEKLLTGENRDAYAALKSMFNSFGLGSLAGKIYDYAKQGYGSDTISLLLQDTSEYKQRFAGNDARVKAGLPVLSPAEYLSVESSYRQVLQDAGLPKGFYDNPADFTKWISQDVSPTEIKSRVDIATAEVTQFDSAAKQQLQQFYGVSDKDLVAYALDRTRGVSLLQKQAATAQFSAEAARRGLTTDRARMEGYISMGLSQSQAAQGFQTVSEELPNLNAIAQRFGTGFGQTEEEGAVFGTSAASTEKRKGLASQERALFGSAQGSSAGGLGVSFQQT